MSRSTSPLPAEDPKPNAFVRVCPSRQLLARIGEKWTLMAVVALADGPVRFGGLLRRLEGVSQKMLSQTLRNLERDGLVTRTLVDERPLRVDYALTERGRDLLPLARALKAWAEANLHPVLTSNVAFDAREP
jgi:DNA-binding HxlR family transcriptional regulator